MGQQFLIKGPGSLPRRVAAVVAVLCINIAVLPCAFALKSAAGCGDCPPAAMNPTMPDSHSHHQQPNAAPPAPCHTAQLECCDLDLVQAQLRTGGPENPKLDQESRPGFPEVVLAAQVQLRPYPSGPPPIYCGSLRLHAQVNAYLN